MNLQKFIQMAATMPETAQAILNALEFDTTCCEACCSDKPGNENALAILRDDVADDPIYHGTNLISLEYFLSQTK